MAKEDSVFLGTIPLAEAERIWAGAIEHLSPVTERIPAASAFGRVTAEAVTARISAPFYHSTAMDGYALRFDTTFGASETTPRTLTLGSEAVRVDTGDPVPEGMNAVVMLEDVTVLGDRIEFIRPVTPWENVRTVGEDIVETELIAPESHALRPVDIGAVLAGGHVEVAVRARPRVAIVPTGSEIVEPGAPLKRGDIIEYSSRVIEGLVREWGGEPLRMPIVPDERAALVAALDRAVAEADIVVLIAGASRGREDFTAETLAGRGEVLVHGIAIKPGKPAILGMAGGKPVVGAPGYPVSTYLIARLFLRPAVLKLLGLEEEGAERADAVLTRQVASQLGVEEFVRVKLGRVGGRTVATPLGRGAGLMMSLVRADGFLRIPAMSEGVAAGSNVEIDMVRPRTEIDRTLVVIGSHDTALDLLANSFKKRHPRYALSSAHVGSMGGLVALGRGECHLATAHLLDEETGEYNAPYIERLLAGRRMVLVNLVYREQGLMVQPGNPKGITGFHDLARPDVTFVNRQRGAGTRLLLDKHLRDLGIDPGAIAGYGREEYTHMAVASDVRTGVADVGLGVLSAARVMGLDFLPVARERYDLVVPEENLGLDMVAALLDLIRTDGEFREAVERMGGYGVEDMGRELWRTP
jgi:putative molybdopterin biosynthesis protein